MRIASFLFAVAACAVSAALPAWAQNPAAYPTAPEQLRTLWHNEQDRRVLVAVLPTWINGEYDTAKPVPKRVEQWLGENKYIARSFGGITAVAPATRAVVPKSFGAPDFYNTGNPWQDKINALPQLCASLTAAQWRQIASPQGLGRSSLSGDQKALWELAVPKPFSFDRTNTAYYARQTPLENVRTLTDTEREQVRLRLKLIAGAYAQLARGTGGFPVISHKNQYERGQRGETFLRMRETGLYEAPERKDAAGVFSYGQSILRNEPMIPKSLPEAFAAKLSGAPIVLAERTADKPMTAGELIDAIGAAIGLKLYLAEGTRSAPVLVANGGSVPASDLLRAYLFATDSTVRVLPSEHAGEQPLYVIAKSREPDGRIVGRKTDWQRSTENGLQERNDAANEQIKAQNPLPLLQFDADDPLPLVGKLRERVFAAALKKTNGRNAMSEARVTVPLGELPASAQKEINATAQRLARTANSDGDYRVHVDTVDIDCSIWLGYVAPGSGTLAGDIDADPLEDLATWMDTSAKDAADVKGRILIVSAQTEAEARLQITAARAAKVREIWLDAPPAVIAATIGTAGDLPVRAVVSLLRVQQNTPGTLPRDENIYGERSRDWLIPDDPAVVRYAAERVRAAASLPGIVGIVLRDVVPPGYRGSDEGAEDGAWTGESGSDYENVGRGLGYTLAHRRGYVAESGSDPVDFIPSLEENSPGSLWHTWTRKRLAPLWAEVRAATRDRPVLLEGESAFASAHSAYHEIVETFVPWEKADAEPPFAALFRNTRRAAPSIAAKTPTLVTIVGNPASRFPVMDLLSALKIEDKPETTVWDLSDRRVPGVADQLRVLAQQAQNP